MKRLIRLKGDIDLSTEETAVVGIEMHQFHYFGELVRINLKIEIETQAEFYIIYPGIFLLRKLHLDVFLIL